MSEIVKYNDFVQEYVYSARLSNGIKCYIIPKKGFVEKQGMVSVRYGSADTRFELDGEKHQTPGGIAHFLEHKMFEQETGNAFDDFINMGGDVNAYTNYTNTAYYFTCTSKFQDNFCKLLDFIQEPYFTDENVQKEKGIITQEINMYRDNPFWRVYVNMQASMYQKNPVRYDIAGTVQDIEGITKEDLYFCYNTFYQPSNMAVVCVGDLDVDTIYKLAGDRIKAKERTQIARLYGIEETDVVRSYIEEKMPIAMPMFSLGFKDCQFDLPNDRKIASAKIAVDIISGDSTNWYMENYENGIIDGSFSREYTGGPFYGASVFSGMSESPEKVRDSLYKTIYGLQSKGIPEEDFQRIKKKHIGRLVKSFNSIDALAVAQVDFDTKKMDVLDLVQAYKSVEKQEVEAWIRSHYSDKNNVLSVIKPEDA